MGLTKENPVRPPCCTTPQQLTTYHVHINIIFVGSEKVKGERLVVGGTK